MQRSMSYDLDGIFASRNQGQLLSGTQGVVRTPGLQQVPSSAYRQGRKMPFSGYVGDRTMRLNGPDDDLTTSSDVDDQSTVPAVPVPGAPAAVAAAPAKDNTKLYLAIGAAAAAYFLFFRK
jgi:hypothetical protein